MSETIDPIVWLKDYIFAKKKITLVGKEIEIEGTSVKLPVDAPTAWKRKDGKGYYTLGQLCLAVQFKDASMGDYSRECGRVGVPQVVFMDKKDVTDFFTGVTNDSRMIEVSRRAETLIRKNDLRSGKPIQLQDPAMRKREEKAEEKKVGQTQFEDRPKLEAASTVADMLLYNEKKIHTRQSVLQNPKKNFLKVLLLGY